MKTGIPSTMGDATTLSTIGDGSLEDMFQVAAHEMTKNIRDLGTDASVVRTITLTIKIKPTLQRTGADIELKVATKPAPQMDEIGSVNIGLGQMTEVQHLDTNLFTIVKGDE